MFGLFNRTKKIKSPTIGFLDLTDSADSVELATDKAAITPLFSSSEDSSFEPPRCHVLFLYCRLNPDGSIQGYGRSLREIIRDSGAVVVVVASENSGPSYGAGAKKERYGSANLVMTLKRNGDAFPKFFHRLFADMKRGVSMPVAWVKLAPQHPTAQHAGGSDAFFLPEAGQIAFK